MNEHYVYGIIREVNNNKETLRVKTLCNFSVVLRLASADARNALLGKRLTMFNQFRMEHDEQEKRRRDRDYRQPFSAAKRFNGPAGFHGTCHNW